LLIFGTVCHAAADVDSVGLLFARSEAQLRRIMETLNGGNGVHAFDFYHSAESERIYIKSGALWAHCWGLALAHFGRNSRMPATVWAAAEVLFCFVR